MPEPRTRRARAPGAGFPYEVVASDPASLRRSVANRLLYSVGKDPAAANERDWTTALSLVVRDRLVERWMENARRQRREDARRVYYLSMEFLPGRMLSNALLALGIHDECREAITDLGLDLEGVQRQEPDPALGNGGLGRLAACFLDSMATLGVPAYGYGIRYDYGMFAQRIRDGRQVETPDHWLVGGNPWEFPRPEVAYPVRFGGRVERSADGAARLVDTDDVLAMAYDTIVPGFDTDHVVTLRLWSARSTRDIELARFNRGDHEGAVEDKVRSENVSRVLYPDDSSASGRELRLRQEYFFASASLQDILRRYLNPRPLGEAVDEPPRDLTGLPGKAAIHLNDTHPAIAVPELMRLLVDEHGLEWEAAWDVCRRVFSYTNHTLMPEALERWPVDLLGSLLPRHLEIIYEINAAFLAQVRADHPKDSDLPRRVSLVDEEGGRSVRMGWLAVLASHRVNGVSVLHSELMRRTLFADFARLFPGRFINITNGVTPRRWLNQANRPLAALVDEHIGVDWRRDLDELTKLRPLAGDAGFRAAFRAAKLANKQRLAAEIRRVTGIEVDPESVFDVQIKRIHEYKRQLLNVLHVITRYHRILADPRADWLPRTVIFAGKAASSYFRAKLIIKLIHDVAAVVNDDPRVGGRLRVVFMPDYGVSVAEVVVPAADLSEQISTAGTEASGTGNMKLALNGAITLGTEDGATLEIRDHVGEENIVFFGYTAAEVEALRAGGYDPNAVRQADPELSRVLDAIGSGDFSPDEPGRFQPLLEALLRDGDHYLVLADYRAYIEAQERVDALYRDVDDWSRRAILNVAGMGPFSTDCTLREYARQVWSVQPAADDAAARERP